MRVTGYAYGSVSGYETPQYEKIRARNVWKPLIAISFPSEEVKGQVDTELIYRMRNNGWSHE